MKKYKISNKIYLDINSESTNKDLIPASKPFEDNKRLVEQVGISINKKLPVLLIGETGTGKTSLVRFLAHKTNNAFRRVNHNGATTVDDIVGKILVNKQGTYWIDGVLTEALRKGYWYLADEINASSADINFIYHCLLDDDGYIVLSENNGEIVKPHPNFRFFATMNPASDYTGTKELNKALMSRFIVVKTDFPSPSTEETILTRRCGIDKDVAEKMVKFAGQVRGMAAKGDKISFTLSTRELLMWADMYKIYEKFIPSAEITLLNKVGPDDFEAIKDLLGLHFKTLDEAPLKGEVPKEEKKEENTLTSPDGKFKVGDRVILSRNSSNPQIGAKIGATATVKDFIKNHFSSSNSYSYFLDIIWDKNSLSDGQMDGEYSPEDFDLESNSATMMNVSYGTAMASPGMMNPGAVLNNNVSIKNMLKKYLNQNGFSGIGEVVKHDDEDSKIKELEEDLPF